LTVFNSTIWRKGDFVRLWLAQAISLLGDKIFALALPLLVYDLTHSVSQMSFVFAAEMLPYLFFSVGGGVLSDIWGRKLSLVFGNWLAAVPLAAIFVLYVTGALRMWHIYAAGFLLSSIVATIQPAFEASIPGIVPREELVNANSIMELTSSTIVILGPAVAGGLIGWLGSGPAMLLDALSFLLAGLILTTIKLRGPIKTSRESMRSVLNVFLEGLMYVPKHRILRWGVFMSTSSNVVLGAYSTYLIFHVRDSLKLSVQTIGLILSLSSVVPLIVAGLVASHLGQRFRRGMLMTTSLALQGFGVIILGLSTSIAGVLLAQTIYTGALTLYTINWRTLRQAVTPNTMIGRVSGVCRGIAFAGASVGGFLGGVLMARFVPAELFIIDGLIVVIIAFIAVLSPIVSFDSELADLPQI
jgi:MFS family permease